MTRKRCGQRRGAGRGVSARARLVRRAIAALASVAAGCLVTQDVDYEALDSQPVIVVTRPRDPIFRVPFVPDDDSNCSDGISFEVVVADRDVEQDLLWYLYLNDVEKSVGRLEIGEDGSEIRRFRQFPCLPRREIQASQRRCNRVTLLVTSDPLLARQQPAYARMNPDFSSAYVEWTVLKESTVDPQVSASECATPRPDAGVSP